MFYLPWLNFRKVSFLSLVKQTILRHWRGILSAFMVAFSATFIAEHYGGPVMLYALLLGIAFNFLSQVSTCADGIHFTSSVLLRVGVACLGVRLSWTQLYALGLAPIIMVSSGVLLTMLIGCFFAKRLGLRREFGMLSGGAVAICGASAAMALASILPKYKHLKRDTILTVAVVTSLSTIAMISYPLLVNMLGLSDHAAILFLGGTIHDVAQVVGAGYIISDPVGEGATYIKLLRVSLLSPAVMAISLATQPTRQVGWKVLKLPLFLVVFFLLVIGNSFGVFSGNMISIIEQTSRWCLVAAIAALGMNTQLKEIVDAGWRPSGLIVMETLFLAGLVLGFIVFLF